MKKWIEDNIIVNGKIVTNRCSIRWFEKNNYLKQYNDIIDKTSFLNNPIMIQRIWHIYNNDFNIHKCENPSCNNTTKFYTFERGYLKNCCCVCAQLNPETRDKMKSTNIKKYGTEYGFQNEDIKNKSKKTCLEKYGVDNVSKSKELSDKKKKTCMKNYGVEWILSDKKRIQDSLFKKYGVRNSRHIKGVSEKITNTKRGDFYDYLFTSDRLKDKVFPLFTKEEYIKGGYYSNYKFKCLKCNNEFLDCLEDGDIPRCTVCYKFTSTFEKEVLSFIKEIYTKDFIIENDKKVLNGKELDIYIPSKNLAIECDGLFWHGEIGGHKDKKYHINKTNGCKKQNIRLIHIFEDEWMYKSEIIKSMLLYRMKKLNNRIYAREGSIKEITNSETKDFLNNNHIQGKVVAKINIGLFYKDELISILTFGKSRYNKKYDYEMLRFCNKRGYVVNGAFSKLFKYFIAKYHPKNVITYADMRYSVGNLYESNGFKFLHYSDPNYYYFKNGEYERFSRVKFQKHKLEKKLAVFNNKRTEYENMQENGWDRIWDCGNSVFIWGTVD